MIQVRLLKRRRRGGEGRSKAWWPMERSKLGGQWNVPKFGDQWNVPKLGGQWNVPSLVVNGM